jgi:hypothetical protein
VGYGVVITLARIGASSRSRAREKGNGGGWMHWIVSDDVAKSGG